MDRTALFSLIYLFCLLKNMMKYDIIIWNEVKMPPTRYAKMHSSLTSGVFGINNKGNL